MSAGKLIRGPKRRVERIRVVVNEFGNTTKTSVGLHTMNDPGTLIRILIDGNFSFRQLLTGTSSMAWMVASYPGGTEVISSGNGVSSNEADVGINELFAGSLGTNDLAANDDSHILPWRRDVKIQRKLKKGDELKLTHQVQGGNVAWYLFGFVYLWFKE